MKLFKKKEKSFFRKMFRRKSKLEKFYDRNAEFIIYCLISLICTGILYLIFFIVNKLTNGNYFLANFLSYFISFTALFFMDQKLFKARPIRKRAKAKQISAFIIIRIIGFPLDSFVLHTLISKFGIDNMAAKVIGSLIMFIYNYLTNKLFVFRKNKFI